MCLHSQAELTVPASESPPGMSCFPPHPRTQVLSFQHGALQKSSPSWTGCRKMGHNILWRPEQTMRGCYNIANCLDTEFSQELILRTCFLRNSHCPIEELCWLLTHCPVRDGALGKPYFFNHLPTPGLCQTFWKQLLCLSRALSKVDHCAEHSSNAGLLVSPVKW